MEEQTAFNLVLISTLGEKVYTKRQEASLGHFEEIIDLNNIASGNYFLIVTGEQNQMLGRIQVVKH